jgi:hypothetical protein
VHAPSSLFWHNKPFSLSIQQTSQNNLQQLLTNPQKH